MQLLLRCPRLPNREQMGDGLPFSPDDILGEVELDDVPNPSEWGLDLDAAFLLGAFPFPLLLPSPFLLVLPNRGCLPSFTETTTG